MDSSTEGTALAIRDTSDLVPTMVSSVEEATERLAQLQAFVRGAMVKGEDYGEIPGVNKPVLLKPGAEKLCEIYGLAMVPTVVSRIEDWEARFWHYEVRVDLVSKRTGAVIGSGVGSCNSREGRYRWRNADRACPTCGATTILKSRSEGWFCWKKKGGCGATFSDDDTRITSQVQGRVENDDIETLVNTILKMAKKRAAVDATLSVTRCSGIFTQDVEDTIDGAPASKPTEGSKVSQPQRTSGSKTSGDVVEGEVVKEFTAAGVIASIESRNGKTNGKPWTLYIIKLDSGQEFVTFDEGVRSSAERLYGQPVTITAEPRKGGGARIVALQSDAHLQDDLQLEPGSNG